MYIRCAVCQASSWIRPVLPGGPTKVRCADCGRSYAVQPPPELGESAEQHYAAALEYAKAHEIDLPAAYSVILGVMSLDQAHELRQTVASRRKRRTRRSTEAGPPTKREPQRKAPGAAAGGRSGASGSVPAEPAYDPNLDHAQQRIVARQLALRHALPVDIALQVVENKLTLRQALLQKAVAPPPAMVERKRRSASALQKLLVLGLATAVVVVVSQGIWKRYLAELNASRPAPVMSARPVEVVATPASAPVVPDPLRGVEIRTDPAGEIVELSGPDPRSVLLAYCSAGVAAGQREPLELAAPVPGLRMGIFQDYGALGMLHAIKIRKNVRSGQWVAGNGHHPIRSVDAVQVPPDARRFSVAQP
jgi:hypothetical protein